MGAAARPVFDYVNSLRLCREMWQFGIDLQTTAATRAQDRNTCIGTWEGVHGEEFRQRSIDEDTSLSATITGLSTEATQWSYAWTEAVTQMNNVLYAEAIDAQQNYDREKESNWEKFKGWFGGGSVDFGGVDVPRTPSTPSAPGFFGGYQFASYYRSGDDLRINYVSYVPTHQIY